MPCSAETTLDRLGDNHLLSHQTRQCPKPRHDLSRLKLQSTNLKVLQQLAQKFLRKEDRSNAINRLHVTK